MLFDLKDDNIIIARLIVEGNTKMAFIEYKLIDVFCFEYASKMHVNEGWNGTVKH